MRLASALILATSLVSVQALAAEATPRPTSQGLSSLTINLPEWHRPLSLSAEDGQLNGEAGVRDFPVFMTTGEANRPAKLKLSYVNAISVMPETFKMIVKVNDVVVGETSRQTAGRPETLSLNIPPGLLVAGFNSVRVTVRQSHRVDCSPDSTYELWTRLMPEKSELVFSNVSGDIRELTDLPAIKPDINGATRIAVRLADRRDSDSLNRASRAVQAAVLFGRFANTIVEINPDSANEAGLDVVVGTAAEVKDATGLHIPGTGSREQLLYNAQTGRATLIVTGENDAELDMALASLASRAQDAKAQGSPAGLRALANLNGRVVQGGETLTFEDLGLESEAFRGRLYRQTLRLQLPSDLLAADYGRVILDADAAYAPHLAAGNKLTVRVNGAPIADILMAKESGEILDKRRIYLPMGAFKPGLNTIDIEARTLTPNDDKCEPVALGDQRERFLLAGTSQVQIPGLARIGAMPNISSAIPGGLSRMSEARDLNLFVPRARPQALETSLSMLAKMASLSGQVTKASFHLDRAPEGVAHVLAIGAYGDMPEATIRAAGINPAKLSQAWQGAPAQAAPVSSLGQAVQVASIGEQVSLPDAILAKAEQTASVGSLTSQIAQASGPLSDAAGFIGNIRSTGLEAYARSAFAGLQDVVMHSLDRAGLVKAPSPELIITPESTLVVAQGAQSKALDHSWSAKLMPQVESTTLILAPTTDELSNSVYTLLSGSLWQRLVGQAAVFNAHDGTVETRVSGEVLLVPTAPFDVENTRLIAAGWLSRNIPVYLAALFGIFLVLTFAVQRVLRSSGVRE
ncbi:cellulose biosynthesis cyclic di-GMP-binding regulatory protein BcsB [Microvirga pudoricolor]|uniref:cellulose biosynthesis cyclic di-GMP-binding regulatory protein BcsB n=1 Tax=Microvirga pudoricolor TaxID=2778729 RepID=UPI00194FF0F9|nr:cellulose biosynthesis cyclic di-GMP-binding regulatory protein BcsB [Microvirga pudoricolor]MBM6593211.1 cellulose biosynthesis cyclic di-GMP-binding regulatory protein BcsB [Microvirga pudoricolor]